MKRFIYFVSLVFIAVFLFLWSSPFIFGDGYGYYHVGRSMIDHQSLTQEEEPEYYPYARHAVSDFENQYVTVYSVGNAVLWLPFLVVASFLDSGDIYTDYFKAFNGHSFGDGLAIIIAAITFALASLYFMYKTVINLGFNKKVSIISVIAVYVSSFALAYVLTNASYSHTYEIFAVAGLLFSLTSYPKKFEKKWIIFSGIFAGLAVLTRPTNIVIILPITLYIFLYQKFKAAAFFVASATPFALLFFYYNYVSYGSPIASGYTEIWGTGLDFSEFNLFFLLFSDIRGLFIWSPLLLLAVGGLIAYGRKSPQGWYLYLLPVTFTIGIYSFWENWWAGDSVGQRFYLNLVPFFVIGLAYIVKVSYEFPKKLHVTFLTVVFLLTTYSFIAFILIRFTPTNELGLEKNAYTQVTPEERFSIFDVYSYHFDLLKDSNSISNYVDNLQNSLQGGRSFGMIALGFTEPLVTVDIDNNTIYTVPDPFPETSFYTLYVLVTKNDEHIQTIVVPEVFQNENNKISYSCETTCKFQSEMILNELDVNTSIELEKGITFFDSDDELTLEIYVSDNVKVISLLDL